MSYYLNKVLFLCFFCAVICNTTACSSSQKVKPDTDREDYLDVTHRIDSIGSKMKLALYALELETNKTFSFNGDTAMPMQSTFKFPLALAILHQCEEQKISLDTQVSIYASDLEEDTWSPMCDSFGTKSFQLSLKDLLYFVTACSDNIACDVLFRFYGGTAKVGSFIAEQGFPAIKIVNTEVELHEDWKRQYRNCTPPRVMSELLRSFYYGKILNKAHTDFLMDLMLHNKTGDARIRAGLPHGTAVADKTGTCYPENGPGTINDIGIITLPDGNHIALSVYITDAEVDVDHGQAAIALATKLVYEYFIRK